MQLDNSVERARIARQIVKDTRDPDSGDTLGAMDRDIIGQWKSVRLLVPLNNPSQLRRDLRACINEFTEILATVDRVGEKDRTALFGAQGRIRRLSQKLNPYRSGGRK